MFNQVPERLDAFYECLDACIDCIAQRMSVDDLRNLIDIYYSDETLTDNQYKILIDIIKEIK